MKKLFKNGVSKFVADALVPTYKKQGWLEEGEEVAPPKVDPPENKTASEGMTTDDPDGDTEDGAAEGEEVFTCAVCGKTYKTEAGLNKHMAKEHPEA